MTRATLATQCASTNGVIHDGDAIELRPLAHVRLEALLDDRRPLAVTCVNGTQTVAITISGSDPPWFNAQNGIACLPWEKNERICRSTSGEDVLVCDAQIGAPVLAKGHVAHESLGVPSWYVSVEDNAASPSAASAASAAPAPSSTSSTSSSASTPGKGSTALLSEIDRRIALAPFEGEGVPASLSSAVTDLLGTELEKFATVEVVTPVEVRAVLSKEALDQLLGCEEAACVGNSKVQELLPAGRLIGGRVTAVDGRTLVSAVLIDLSQARVLARISQPIAGEFDDVAAAMKTFALVLLDQDPVLRGASIVVKGEVTADLLERVRVGQREKGVSAGVLLGTTLLTSLSSGDAYPRSNAGAAARLTVDVPIASVLNGAAAAGFGYSNGRFISRENFFIESEAEPFLEVARGEFSANANLLDFSLAGGVKLRPPVGVVLPYATFMVSGHVLVLDVEDQTFKQDADSPGDAPALLVSPLEYAPSTAAGVGVRFGSGVDYLVTTNLMLTLDATAFATFHGLELITEFQNVVDRVSFPPLYGFIVTVGGGFVL